MHIIHICMLRYRALYLKRYEHWNLFDGTSSNLIDDYTLQTMYRAKRTSIFDSKTGLLTRDQCSATWAVCFSTNRRYAVLAD